MLTIVSWAVVFAVAAGMLFTPSAPPVEGFRRGGTGVIMVIAFVMLVLVISHRV